jgi:hypothetical protein
LALLVVATGLVHHRVLTAHQRLIDEKAYVDAFSLVTAGASPYEGAKYRYPPAFAVVGAALLEGLGERPLFLLLRGLDLLGICVVAWGAMIGSRWPLAVRAALAVAVLVSSPIVADGLQTGNVSFLFLAATVVALLAASRRPRAAGALLGSAIALKPLTAPVVPVLLVHRAPSGARHPSLVAAVAALAAGALWSLVGIRFLGDFASRIGGLPDVSNVSFSHVLWCFGVEVPAVALFALITALGVWVASRRPLGVRELLVLATSTSLLALPINNPSTMVMSFPAQALALELAVGRWQAGSGRRWVPRWGELLLVAAAAVSVHGSLGVVAASSLSRPVRGVVALIPLLAVLGSTTYALAVPRARGAGSAAARSLGPS